MDKGDTFQENYHPTKYVCARLDIADSTLRKWCIALEKNGYEFTRTTQNRRLYIDQDLKVLDHLKELVQDKGMSLENGSIIVASRFVDQRSFERTPTVRAESAHNEDSPLVAKLNEHIEKQEKFNQELLSRLDKQNDYINNRLDQRDKALMETMNKMLEQRKEEVKLLEEQAQENWFKRLFKKKG